MSYKSRLYYTLLYSNFCVPQLDHLPSDHTCVSKLTHRLDYTMLKDMDIYRLPTLYLEILLLRIRYIEM